VTEWFEVRDRDGPARIGELRLDDPLTTPALVDDILVDAGSRWVDDRDAEGRSAALTILPHRGHPAGTDEAVAAAFDEPIPDLDAPAAAVVSRHTAADRGTDAYVLSGASGIVGDARAFVETVTAVRGAIPDDAALYLPGVATPANAALLVHAGVDLIDATAATVAGTRRDWLAPDGRYDPDRSRELPRAEPGAGGSAAPDAVDADECVAWNRATLAAELARVRERIRSGTLRDYLEGRVRHAPWQTAALRRLDRSAYAETRAPIVRGRAATLTATTDDALHRPVVRRFRERVADRYAPRFDRPVVLLPCSARKPYGESRSYGRFRSAIGYRAHAVTLTSPLGVVPQELETTYPAQHYDAAVTGHWSAEEVGVVGDTLAAFLDRHDAPRVVAHVRGGYRSACERAADRIDADVTYTIDGPDAPADGHHPTDGEALDALDAALDALDAYSRRDRLANTVRAIADHQFGRGAGDALFGDVDLQGQYPKLRALGGDGDQLAAMVPEYGTLALALAGGRRWLDSGIDAKRVSIDAFVPHGSVLAPGVVGTDASIRVGDEVVVEGPEALAVGRAAMHGAAMAGSTRGVAVDVRHVDPR
jgi:archaeosine synthase